MVKTSSMNCAVCSCDLIEIPPVKVPSNVRKYRSLTYALFRCPQCNSINCEPINNLPEMYVDYPIRNQSLNYFLKAWFGILKRRIFSVGVQKTDRILDFGCNTGLFMNYLRSQGFESVVGYDPYVEEFKDSSWLNMNFDLVMSSDIIEHELRPREHFEKLAPLVRNHGLLMLQTPNASGIDLQNWPRHIHQIHAPFHQVILSGQAILELAQEFNLKLIRRFDRWYMDSPWPGCSRLFIEEILRCNSDVIDTAYEPPVIANFFKNPKLPVYFMAGYFLEENKRDHSMFVFRKQGSSPR